MLRLYLSDSDINSSSQAFYFILYDNEDTSKILYVSEEKSTDSTSSNERFLDFDTFFFDDNAKVDIQMLLTNKYTLLNLYRKSSGSDFDFLVDSFKISSDKFNKELLNYLLDNSTNSNRNNLVLFKDNGEHFIQTFDRIRSKDSNLRKSLESNGEYIRGVESYNFNQLLKIQKLTNYYLKNLFQEITELKQKVDKKLHYKKNVNNLKLNYYSNSNRYILKNIDRQQGRILDLKDEIYEINVLKQKINENSLKLLSKQDNVLECPINNPLYRSLLENKELYKNNIKSTNELLLNILQIELKLIKLENVNVDSFHEIQRFNNMLGNLLLYLQIIHKILKLPFFFNSHKMMVRYKSSQSFIVIVTEEETSLGLNKLIIPLYIISLKSLDETGDYYQQFKIGIDWMNSKILMIKKYVDDY